MSIERIYPEDIEVFSLEVNPRREFISSSTSGTTGSVYIYARRSPREKDIRELFHSTSFQDEDFGILVEQAKRNAVASGSNENQMLVFLSSSNAKQSSIRKQQQVNVIRFVPGMSLGANMRRKQTITNLLMPYYRDTNMQFGYANYQTLNFFTASSVPTSSVFLYPQQVVVTGTSISGKYIPGSGAFSIDCWLNPKYTSDRQGTFKPGTILHLSSVYALSLVSGSSKDITGKTDGFRLLLQLSSSADISPSIASTGSRFVFLSTDNSLRRNTWHHVTIRWGTNSYNLGSGSFIVDGQTKGTFVIPSSSIVPPSFFPGKDNPTVLCVGNFYNGPNSGSSAQAMWFTTDTAQREGLTELIATTGNNPVSFSFSHPLNAELNELKLYDRSLSTTEISDLESNGPVLPLSGVLFYLPPLFTQESPTRKFYSGKGGVLTTPFFTQDGTTKHPFNLNLAFNVGGHYINLENHARDFATGNYPRLWDLSGSEQSAPVSVAQTANSILYSTASNVKRSLTLLPCDNGRFVPRYELLSSLSGSLFVTDLGVKELGLVNLRNLYSTSSIFRGLHTDSTSSSILGSLMGPDPELSSTLGTAPGQVPTILQRTRDGSSNQVVVFDISNLYYGNRIKPGSLMITDNNLSGSNSQVNITIKDDGNGNLYRADSSGSHATWNSVGNVFYNEGILFLKSPLLFWFGETGFVTTFLGEHSVHTLKINCVARSLAETSSSNPTYVPVSSSDSSNETDAKYVYVTELLLHDDNLNVVGRTRLAQPVQKRTSDRFVIKWTMDM